MIGASSVPMLTSRRAGSVMMTATTAARMTACAGTWFFDRLAHHREPGTAPSRLNAYSMRLVLVMQAIEQKNCPIAEMSSTTPATCASRAWAKMTATPPPPAVTASASCTANRKASRSTQPPIAE